MTLPWFLNPWREIKRLRDDLEFARGCENMAWATADAAIALKDKAEAENAELKRTIEQLSKWGPRDPRPAGLGEIRMQSATLCGCQKCTDARPGWAGPGKPGWRYACDKCGNKRCPHHQWHEFKCTGSNEPDQVGEVE